MSTALCSWRRRSAPGSAGLGELVEDRPALVHALVRPEPESVGYWEHVLRRSAAGLEQLPAGLPGSLRSDLPRDVEQRHALQHPGHRERPGIDRSKTDRGHQLEHAGLGWRVVAGDEAVSGNSGYERVGLACG